MENQITIVLTLTVIKMQIQIPILLMLILIILIVMMEAIVIKMVSFQNKKQDKAITNKQ